MGISQRIVSYSSSSRNIRTERYMFIHRPMSEPGSVHALETTHSISQVITYHELFQGLFKKLIVDSHTTRVFHRGQRILDHC